MKEEKKLQTLILNYLKELSETYPIYAERRNAGAYSYKAGTPDLYAVINGTHIEIEVKSKNGQLSPLQEQYRQRCNRLNIIYLCVNDFNQFKTDIDNLLNKLYNNNI